MHGRRHLVIAMMVGVLAIAGPRGMMRAQTPDFTLPPNNLIPNYNRVAIGQREALEGGAFVARTNDAGSNWYNPAGLAQSEKTALNAAANAYELIRISLEGVGASERSTRFTQIGTFFGGVIGEPIVHKRAVRLGFSYTRPVSWSPGGIDASLTLNTPPSFELLGLTTSGSFVSVLGGIAAGVQMTDRLRAGVGVNLAITTLHQNQTLSDRLVNPTSAVTGIRAANTDGSSQELVATVGLQWDATSRLSFGALASPPSLRVGGSSTLAFQSSRFATSGSSDLSFLDQDATFRYKVPGRIFAGGALRFDRGEFELDVRYYGGLTPYDLLSSDARALLVQTDAAGVPTSDSIPFVPAVYDVRSIVNLAVGGSYALSKLLRIHLGVFTDNSPVSGGVSAPFRSIDLTGISTGVTLSGTKLSGSLGLTGSWGTADARPVGPTLGGSVTDTRVQVRSLNLLYALSYEF